MLRNMSVFVTASLICISEDSKMCSACQHVTQACHLKRRFDHFSELGHESEGVESHQSRINSWAIIVLKRTRHFQQVLFISDED
ncbi:hypothetical protein CEXT_595261 [Caerostris extrusa]|uniref:Secreted protein n=1 Tax=Caerostris extrusa TaxID=172846 RepID=A0AAV4S0L8_CAEEX|nr:hypothetical protein CEXT_595261 [Caerostris extrusa]